MTKFIVTCLLALALSSALAHEQDADEVLRLMQSDDEGISFASENGGAVEPPKEHVYFTKFCEIADNEITNYVQTKVAEAKNNVYSLVMTTAQDIGHEVLDANKKEVDDVTQIIDESVPKDGLIASTEERIEETVRNIPNNGLFQKVKNAIFRVIMNVIEVARSAVFMRLDELKEQLGAEGLKENLESVCSALLTELMPTLDKRLTESKKEIKSASSKSEAAEITAMLKGANLSNVGCKFTGRVQKVAKFCDIVRVTGDAIFSLIGVN